MSFGQPCTNNARRHVSRVYDVAVADVTVAIFYLHQERSDRRNRVAGTPLHRPTGFRNNGMDADKAGGEALEEGQLSDGRTARVEHHSLSAQGNVVAAAALSRSTRENRADYYVFYGCCGTVDSKLVGQVFRAERVSYLSLGVVVASPDGEVVKLKNKWIVRTHPDEQAPLDAIEFRAGSAGAPGSVSGLEASRRPRPGNRQGDQGFARCRHQGANRYAVQRFHLRQGGLDVLIGACRLLRIALSPMQGEPSFVFGNACDGLVSPRVLVLRVVTDALTDKADHSEQDQLDFLRAVWLSWLLR